VLQSMRSLAKYIFWFLLITFIGGFILLETSGLLTGNTAITRGTSAGSVNGEDISYDIWQRTLQQRMEQISQQRDHPLTLDEQRRLEDAVWSDLVSEILLRQEYQRRGIAVTDDEIRLAAFNYPHPDLMQNELFQTDGQFDLQKYQRFLASQQARQQGVTVELERYYRTEIPKQKLFDQVAAGAYVTDAQLWRAYQDAHDSAQVTFVAFDPMTIPDSVVKVSDAEVRDYFRAHEKEFDEQPGTAVVSVVSLPRVIAPQDTAAVRDRLLAIRQEILGGAKFEDVARRESADTISGADGGSIGRVTKGQVVAEFDSAMARLRPGEISQPVLTRFGYHLIRVDERKGDTTAARHILLRMEQSDSNAVRLTSRADLLARAADATDRPRLLDSTARSLGLPVVKATVIEGEPLTIGNRYVPSVSAWAFSGAKPGETSELFESDEGYFLARLDSVVHGGKPNAENMADEIRLRLTREKKLQMLQPRARQVADAVRGGATLEQAAQRAGVELHASGTFTRAMPVPGMGTLNRAVGTAFGLPVGAVSAPVETPLGVYVVRVDRRVNASREAFEAQKSEQRQNVMARLRQQRVQEFLTGLRESADIDDHRRELQRRMQEQV
jgi:peptidyl-prolyl cis-trans isomerase D